MPFLRHPPIAARLASVPTIAALAFLISPFFDGVLSNRAGAQEQPATQTAPGFMKLGLGQSPTTAKNLPRTATAMLQPPVRLHTSPGHDYAVYEGKAADGIHDTLWLKGPAAGPAVDLLAPADAHWPGTGATAFMEWLDNNRLAFTMHCGTGCTSLEIINVSTRDHDYFCTDGTFFLSPDKHHAVGESAEPLVGDPRGGLAILDLERDGRPSRQEDCVAVIRGDYVCLHGTTRVQADYITFKRWATDSRSFVYKAAPICSDGKGYHPRERVFTLP
jgi:hypothetical protein